MNILRKAAGLARAVIAAFLCLVCAVAGTAVFLNSAPSSPPSIPAPERLAGTMSLDEDGGLLIEVRDGESALSVGRRLETAGVIRSRHFWRLLSRLRPAYLKTGVFRVELPAAQTAIRSALETGRQTLVRVTVPEGVTLKKTARLLEAAGVCPAPDFLAAASGPALRARFRVPGPTMEGYLYPDTYLFPRSFPAAQAAQVMADTFFRRLGEFAPEALSLTPDELNRRVIIASIVEREYRVEEEAPRMAGVFYNRLRIGMALQSCATVEYVLTEILGRPHPERLFFADTEIDDPYNTYTREGLPPGPISAPGRAALTAAFRPEPSEFLYFRLTDPEAGRHYFSRTLDGHLNAGVLYTKR